MASEKVVILNKENFETEVIQSDKLVLVDFWAQWCGPCRAVAPIIDELAEQFEGTVRIGKVNVDEEGEMAAKYKIMSIPTLMLFKNGEMIEKIIGVRTKDEFVKLLDTHK